jgi:hypothetical protein
MPQQVSILAALNVGTPWSTLTPEQVDAVRAALANALAGFRVVVPDPAPHHNQGHVECEVVVARVIAKPGGEA